MSDVRGSLRECFQAAFPAVPLSSIESLTPERDPVWDSLATTRMRGWKAYFSKLWLPVTRPADNVGCEHAIWTRGRRPTAASLSQTHLTKPWRTCQQQAIYATSRIRKLRKSSSAASQNPWVLSERSGGSYLSLSKDTVLPPSE